MVLLLEPRAHYGEPGDLPDELAAELGLMIARIERAIRSIGEIGRVHVCRWGDGGEHLHWWFMARPARLPQLIGSFAAIWDDILPPTPEDIWRANLDAVVAALREANPEVRLRLARRGGRLQPLPRRPRASSPDPLREQGVVLIGAVKTRLSRSPGSPPRDAGAARRPPTRRQHRYERRRREDGCSPVRPRPPVDIAARRPPEEPLPEHEERRVAVGDERPVREALERRLVTSLPARSPSTRSACSRASIASAPVSSPG